MTPETPTTTPHRILIAVGQGASARWVLWLAEALQKRPGAEVRIRVVEEGAKDTALATLLSLERMLIARHRPGGADRIGRAELGEALLEPSGFRPDVVVDLTDAGLPVQNATLLRPLYDGRPGETALASALFFRGTPQIAIQRIGPSQAEGRVVAAGTASLEAAAGIGGGIEAVASRVVTLLLKALAEDQPSSRHPRARPEDLSTSATALQPTSPNAADPRDKPEDDGRGGMRSPGTPQSITRKDILKRTAKDVARAAVRAAYRLCCHGSHWRVGWRFVEPGGDVWSRRDLGGVRWNVLADPVDHFYADPLPLHWQGRDYLFFEDLDHKTEKGIISVVAFDEAGRPGPAMPVLEEPWHLSYPFLIEHGGEIFMIPESSANRDIAIYRAVDFPTRWERHAVLVEGVEAADATIVEQDGLLWLFAVVRDGVGGYSDTLAIWWARDLFGPWTPHAGNPVLVDDRTARPAGNFVRQGGALYRPVQDCRFGYGVSLNFMKVTRLDREGFEQRGEGQVSAGGPWPGKRIHTLNYNGRLETIDGFTLRPKFKPLADLVDRRYEPPSA